MSEITPATRPNLSSSLTEDEKVGLEHVDDTTTAPHTKNLSEAQQTLALAAEQEKAKPLGTFTAIKYYWVAFLWSQFASFGTVLVGYDGTVSVLSGSRLSMLIIRRSPVLCCRSQSSEKF